MPTQPRLSYLQTRAFPALVWILAAVFASAVGWWSVEKLGVAPESPWRPFPNLPWLDGFARWDSYWYRSIADVGYGFELGEQSNYAFFPGYGVALWAVGSIVGDYFLGGVIAAAMAALASLYLFQQWLQQFLHVSARTSSLVALAFGPSSFYLAGVAYSESLFLASALGAFVLIEKRRPVAAALAALPAMVTRPIGIALMLGLTLRSFELVSVSVDAPSSDRWSQWSRSPLKWVLLSLPGLAVYPIYLWITEGDPFLFIEAGAGWGHGLDLSTILKVEMIGSTGNRLLQVAIVVQLAILVLAFICLPAVGRMFGRGYVAFCAVAILLPALVRPTLLGVGRYVLLAFPIFAVVAETLRRDLPRARWIALAVSVAAFGLQFSLFVRWVFVG